MIKSAWLMPKNINCNDKIITVSLIPTDPIASVGSYSSCVFYCDRLIRSSLRWEDPLGAYEGSYVGTPRDLNCTNISLAQWPIHKIYMGPWPTGPWAPGPMGPSPIVGESRPGFAWLPTEAYK